ncbi:MULTISPECIES: hypothetical protein [unclassified Streptomyces]|uniref:hypothetical protein n=1 Tax=unclassified Streptomyces TaxID=2593676 RepID=UPI002E28BFF4|nr:hypothetical protein [Streptomyces sp. NBC_01423]WSX91955.1 hypothetical protein OH827_16055 [Streptomyces sp. NBC_00891]WSY06432.1 hypothetical protein OG464_16055 [Streptomyces sp. NBC_00890]WSZ08056.1 hypothetical protein OG704_16055 [Streptomyces sp. NBC_00869]WSZ24444.1 hypothetical protein OG498_17510 [Streptomyces sp. NBC_00870]
MSNSAPPAYPAELPIGALPEPVPVEGCALCANQAQERQRARANGDASTATDLNVRMRRHQRADHA